MEKFEVPREVQEAARKGLELRERHGRGGTEVGAETARRLAGGRLSAEEVRHVAQYFPRHAGDHLERDGADGQPPSNGYIAWLLWGGDAGRAWSEGLAGRAEGEAR